MSTAPDGTFRFWGLPADWSGSLRFPRHLRVADRERGESQYAKNVLLVPAPEQGLVAELIPVLRLVGRVVEISGGNPVARAHVQPSLVYSHATNAYQGYVVADAYGRFGVLVEEPSVLGGKLRIANADQSVFREIAIGSRELTGDVDLGDLPLVERDGTVEVMLRVVDDDGHPVAGACSAIAADAPSSLPTDGAGRTTLRGVVPGLTVLCTHAVGFAQARTPVPSELNGELLIALERAATLEVRFEGPDGSLARHLAAWVIAAEHPLQQEQPCSWNAWARSGASPTRLLPDAGVGIVALRANADTDGRVVFNAVKPHLPLRIRVESRFGTVDLHEQDVPPLAAGERRTVAVRMPRAPRRLVVRALDEQDRPLAGTRVVVTWLPPGEGPGRSNSQSRTAEPDGTCVFEDVYAEALDLGVEKAGYVPFHDHHFPVLDDQRVDVRLRPGLDLRVVVEDAAGRRQKAETLFVLLDSGAYLFAEEVAPGEYLLRSLPDEPVRVQAQVSGSYVERTHDPRAGALTITLPRSGTVVATVALRLGDSGGADVALWLEPIGDGGLQRRVTAVPSDPSVAPVEVRVDSVLPGRYRALLRTNDVQARELTVGTELVVAADETTQLFVGP
jgi:hypothetical protein